MWIQRGREGRAAELQGVDEKKMAEDFSIDSDPLLLPRHRFVPLIGVVDYRGRPIASRSTTGGWTSALFIIGVEVAERFAYYGVSSNLITYLTDQLAESTATASAAVNTWSGVSYMLPLLWAFVADSYLGRYRTILFASMLYVLGLAMLTLSSVMPTLRPSKCSNTLDFTVCHPTQFQTAFFFFSIYLVAFAQGGHKPCVQAFGADQFDQNDPEESISRSSFFNWWYCFLCAGTVVTILVLNYVQENIGWGLGFGIPCFAMMLALCVFLLGTKTYRFYVMEDKSPFARIGRTIASLVRSWGESSSVPGRSHHITSDGEAGDIPVFTSDQSKLEEGDIVNAVQVEEAKGVLRLFPIWATCLIYAVVFAQSSTFFTKQGSTLDRRIGSNLKVPPASLQSFISISIVAFIPIYDRILIPIARRFSKIPTGFTLLQRIGNGMVLSMVAMVIAALVEIRRLQTARDFGLVDMPNATIPMSLWWLVPQYVLYGISEVFTMVGLQEFFYDQVPDSLRSLGLSLYLSVFGIGNFISSFLVSAIDRATKTNGDSWFSNNLNRAHLDYFYWLLAGLNALELVIYLIVARSYVYKKKAVSAP